MVQRACELEGSELVTRWQLWASGFVELWVR